MEYNTYEYKLGDIVNGKKILKIELYKSKSAKIGKYTVECMKCHRIYKYNSLGNLCVSNPKNCLKCKSNYLINGKLYHNYNEIEQDFGADPNNVIRQWKIHNGDVSQVGKGTKSKYSDRKAYQVGDMIGKRKVIGLMHGCKRGTKYVVKCENCGKIIAAYGNRLKNTNCKCIARKKENMQ